MGPTRNVSAAEGKATPAADSLARLRQRLAALVQRCLGEAVVSFAAPAAPAPAGRGTTLYLLDVVPAGSPARQPHVLQFGARFLVSTWADDPAAAADDLAELLFAALAEPGLEVLMEPLPAAAWAAFGVAPRATFVLTAPVRRERHPAVAPAVKQARLKLTSITEPPAADAAPVALRNGSPPPQT